MLAASPHALHLRAPGAALRVVELLTCACPGLDRGVFADWATQRAIRVAGESVRDLDRVVAPGTELEVGPLGASIDGEAWPELRAEGDHAVVRTVTPPWRRGTLPWFDDVDGGDPGIDFECGPDVDGLTDIALRWGTLPERLGAATPFRLAAHLLGRLARSGLVVLGDPFHGGIVTEGGPAWWRGRDAGSAHVPEISAFVGAPAEGSRPSWRISDATARVLGRGHPWIRIDDETEDPAVFRPGARVALVTADGRAHGDALVEGAGRAGGARLRAGDVAGRAIASGSDGSAWSVEACVARALERRADLIDDTRRTDAFRLVHGEADGLPGLHVDRLGPLLRVLVTARCAAHLVDRALVALGAAGPRVVPGPWRVIEVLHLDERVPGRFERVRVHPYAGDPEGSAELGRHASVREHGLVYRVHPGLLEPDRSAPGFGLFLDQRENRAALAGHLRRARGETRVLNLFAHTGAFSVAALAAGAAEVVSVDLSAAYLRRLDENLVANAAQGVDPGRHVGVVQDGRRYLERLDPAEQFDAIVLDPPTAAAAGRHFFSVRKDVVPMVARCLAQLAPGGRLLLTLNDRKARRRIEPAIRDAAAMSGVRLASIEPARPARDFPHLEGFDEGDPFAGAWVRVEDAR